MALELLSPAGSPEALRAAVQSGCGVLEDIQGTIQAPLEPSSRVCSFIDGKIHMNLEGGKQHVEIDMSPVVGSTP